MTETVHDSESAAAAEGLSRVHSHPGVDLPSHPPAPGPAPMPPIMPRSHHKIVQGELPPGQMRHSRRVVLR